MWQQVADTLNPVIEDTDKLLWEAYQAGIIGNYGMLRRRLIFPRNQRLGNNNLRVSEREATFLFTSGVEQSNLLYAVEVPTVGNYQESGEGERSALIDVGVYSPQACPLLNVEFKAGGMSVDAKDTSAIDKDIRKLVREPLDGLWFHTLERVDRETITKVCGVIKRQLLALATEHGSSIMAKRLVFHFCCVQFRFAIQKELAFQPTCASQQSLTEFFRFVYTVPKDRLTVADQNGWKIISPI